MGSVRIQQNQSERIETFFVNTATIPLSGLTPNLTIRRQSDTLYYNGTVFATAFASVSMSAVDPINQGGVYEFTFDTTGLPDETYSLMASGTGAANSPQLGELKVGDYVDFIDAPISNLTNSLGGGSNIVNIKGVWTKKEKDRLFKLIQDNAQGLNKRLNTFAKNLVTILAKLDTKNAKELIKKLTDMQEYIEAQTKLIETSFEEQTLGGGDE